MTLAPLVLALALAPGQLGLNPAIGPRAAVAIRFKTPYIPATPPALVAASGIEVTVGPLPENVGGAADETILRAAHLGVTAEEMLSFFRLRTPPAPNREKIEELIKQLGADTVPAREAAQQQLVSIGTPALPLVRLAVNNLDEVEAATRARQILSSFETSAASTLVVNAARVLASRKPAGAAAALIGYLPYCEDNVCFQECEGALMAVALRDGKPDPDLLKAMKDVNAIRRGTAAQVVSQAGGPAYYPALRPLLKDPTPSVRLRVALGLVGAYDAAAVPVLIDLLHDLPPSLRPAAEEYLHELAGEWVVSGPKGNDRMSRKLRRDVWQAWWKATDGSTLLEVFRSRTPSEEDREKIDSLINKLDDKDPGVREAASTGLVGMGRKAASQLRRATNSSNSRIAAFAGKALEAIEKGAPSPLPGAAARLLGLRKPDGAIETLLGYLAVSESEEIHNRLIDILAVIGAPSGKADEALLKGLKSPSAVRRAAAVQALCRARATAQFPTLARMLDDKDPLVRYRIAEGLTINGDRTGVPAMIASLREVPLEMAWDAEEILHRVAGDAGPTESVSEVAASRTRVADAWAKWWKDRGATVDLARVDFSKRESGNLLVVEQWNPAKGGGRVLEVDRSGKERWALTGMQWPNNAQMLRNGNVLCIEQQNRVTERERKTGKIVWDRRFGGVIYAERLPDGKTFLGCQRQLFIVDKEGRATFTHNYNLNTILAVRRFRDGSMAYVSYSGHYVRLDSKGNQVKTYNMANWNTFGITGAEILPGDRVAVSVSNFNKVYGFGPDGKEAWSVPAISPGVPNLTPAGNLLVSTNNQTCLIEIDRRGKIVKETKGLSYKPYRVIRR